MLRDMRVCSYLVLAWILTCPPALGLMPAHGWRLERPTRARSLHYLAGDRHGRGSLRTRGPIATAEGGNAGPPRSPPRAWRWASFGADGDGSDGDGRCLYEALRLTVAVLAVAVSAAPLAGAMRAGARIALLWLLVAPILARYGAHFALQALTASPEDLRTRRRLALHVAMAPHALAIINRLQGGYVKMGQVCSNRPDLLPVAYVQAFSTLQDKVQPRPWSRVRPVLERALPGGDLTAVFAAIDEDPLGVASVAQVHKAVLRDSGARVVIKVQHEGARALFMQDLANIRVLARIALPPMGPVVAEIRRRFRTEFDFGREARDLGEIGSRMRAAYPGRVRVPRPFPELCSRMVVVMEYLEGPKLTDALARNTARAIGRRNAERMRARVLLGDSGDEVPCDSPGDRARFLLGIPMLWLVRQRAARQLRTLAAVEGHQVLVDGIFNADPHAGNVLCGPDGRLGLIDFGQVQRLTPEQRTLLARLVVALADGDDDDAAAAFAAMGFRTKKVTPAVALRLGRLMFDQDDNMHRRPSSLLREMTREAGGIKAMPLEYVMVARVSLLLRGLGSALGVQLRIARLWKPYAMRHLRTQSLSLCRQPPSDRNRLATL